MHCALITNTFTYCLMHIYCNGSFSNRNIKIANTSGVIGDKYETVDIEVAKDNLNFEQYGLNIIHKDYYHYLRNYCITLRSGT